jgi:hypothetical protein
MIEETYNNIEKVIINNNILAIKDWQILENTEEIIEKNKIQSYIISDIHNNINLDSNQSYIKLIILNSKDFIISDNTKYIIYLLQKSLKDTT